MLHIQHSPHNSRQLCLSPWFCGNKLTLKSSHFVNLSRSCRKGYSHHPWWRNIVPCGNLRQGGDAGSRRSKAALGSSLRKGKRLVTFDFTLLHLSSVILSCPCVPLLSIEENTWEKYLKGYKPFLFLSFTVVALDLPSWLYPCSLPTRCRSPEFSKFCTNVMPVPVFVFHVAGCWFWCWHWHWHSYLPDQAFL